MDRPILVPNIDKPIINAADMSVNITGPATIIQMLPGISYDVSWTGTPTGVITIEVSNSYRQAANGTITNAGSWSSIPASLFQGNFPTPSGSAGNGFIDVFGTEAYAIRLVYTAASGVGNLTVVAAAKVS